MGGGETLRMSERTGSDPGVGGGEEGGFGGGGGGG